MKKSTKKLSLKRETVNTLSNDALAGVNGATGLFIPVVGPIIANPIDKYAYGRSSACPGPGGTVFTCGWDCHY